MNSHSQLHAFRKGFTYLELTMVIATIGMLAAIVIPALARARQSARRGACFNNLVQVGMCLQMYADENDRYFPYSGGQNNADCLYPFYGEYASDFGVFYCPSDSNTQKPKYLDTETGIRFSFATSALDQERSLRASYDYLGAYTKSALRRPPGLRPIARIPLVWDITPATLDCDQGHMINHVPAGCNVYYMDGSAEFVLLGDLQDDGLPTVAPGVDYMAPKDFVPKPEESEIDRLYRTHLERSRAQKNGG